MMRKYAYMPVNHGSGREFIQIAVIGRQLAKMYEKVYITAFNKYFAEALAAELDNVVVIDGAEINAFWHKHWKERNEIDIFSEDPYGMNNFSMRRLNIYSAWATLFELPSDVERMLPVLKVPSNIEEGVKDFAAKHDKFIIFQRAGGQNPVGARRNENGHICQPYNTNEIGLKRSYPLEKSERLVQLFRDAGYEVLQYCLENEPHVKGAIYFNTEQNQLFYMELAKYADGVVTIDSSLMHLTIANCKKMVVVWGQTSVKSFGYRKAINIQLNDEDSFGGPSMTGVQLFPEVKFPDPDVVFKAFEEGTYRE
ncbi:MAG: hypothetical protein IIZ93_13915 [Acidaminococcaceae bacterium]|nr:hypothetical protein [Acidaminococcaceae bacterium]